MLIPFISSRSTQRFGRRKRGEGEGEGESSGGGGSSGEGESSGSGSKGSGSTPGRAPVSVNTPAGSDASAVPYGGGSSKTSIIGAGLPFAGQSIGGGTRSSIFGTIQYGSGYPGLANASVLDHGFPFYFWPITFGNATGAAVSHGLNTSEYGTPDNSSRPGGPLFDAPFQSPDGIDTYHVLADNATVQALIPSVTGNCSLRTTSITAVPFNDSDPDQPKPEQVVQYYRGSSIALTLDGYNDTSVFSSDDNVADTPLPANLNATFLDCLNQTIGVAAPLIDSGVLSHMQIHNLLPLVLLVVHWLNFSS
ncbi:hypothetical protein BU17DRAFT_73030 [Hysterangium stoloniferum]|nr:hypothetical protein BU17DRAFT_73030 [Hysterangium stoloniferum]